MNDQHQNSRHHHVYVQANNATTNDSNLVPDMEGPKHDTIGMFTDLSKSRQMNASIVSQNSISMSPECKPVKFHKKE